MTIHKDRFLEIAIAAAKAAAQVQMESFGRIVEVDQCVRRDVKLRIDCESEHVIRTILNAHFPDHAIYSEETGLHNGIGDYLWIVDPLDGSVNYFYGQPYFCVSLACFQNPMTKAPSTWICADDFGLPVVAVVYAPALEELYSVIAGVGASLNEERLYDDAMTRVEHAMVGTSFGSDDEVMRDMFEKAYGIAKDARKVRCLGSSALGIAHVAAGKMNAHVQRSIYSWDIAAACMIAHAAGCFVKIERDGVDKWKVVACNHGLAHYFKEMI
jgi:fructose-1,6-bisphosphatase/inositol monophosphatase family enzyme